MGGFFGKFMVNFKKCIINWHMVVSFYNSIRSVGEFQLLYILVNTWYCYFLFFICFLFF